MKRVYFETQGCSTNFSESEMMAGLLARDGYETSLQAEDADLIVVNVCTVKGTKTAAKEIKKQYKFAVDHGKKLVVSGCIPRLAFPQFKKIAPEASFVSTHNITKIGSAAQAVFSGEQVAYIDRAHEDKSANPRVRLNPHVSILQINNSCSGACTFCSTVLIKGKLKSYDEVNLLHQFSSAVKEGVGEFWLTSMDTASYGIDETGESKLPQLVKKICEIGGDFRMRVGMLNPDTIAPVVDEMISAMKSEKVYKFLHIPIQAGNNRILKLMNRKYTREEYFEIVKRFREEIPDIVIATDIICGFPGETREEFMESCDAVEKLNIDVVNISRFQGREGTAASVMDGQIDGGELKKRSRVLSSLFRKVSLQQNKKMAGWKGWCYVAEKRKDYIARTSNYKQVVIESDQDILGKWVYVEVKTATQFVLQGEILETKEAELHGISR